MKGNLSLIYYKFTFSVIKRLHVAKNCQYISQLKTSSIVVFFFIFFYFPQPDQSVFVVGILFIFSARFKKKIKCKY